MRTALLLLPLLAAGCARPPQIYDALAREDGAVKFTATGDFAADPRAAKESAVRAARDQMRDWLAKQDPPVRRAPPLDLIAREMVVQEHPPEVETILNGEKRYRLTVEARLRPVHVRDLRERDRAFAGLWFLSGAMAVLGVITLAFRVDEWTKGFLTPWLVAGAGALSAALVAVWWFVR
jgi:hypothetical protein